MGDLSEHFSLREFACQGEDCCGGTSAPDTALVAALEDLRGKVGSLPIVINSGFRCQKHNESIGSKSTSQHCLGRAADVKIPEGLKVETLHAIAEVVPLFKGIGLYDTFLHVDVRTTGPARWDNRS